MASRTVDPRPTTRPMTSCGSVKMNLPVIAHPRANLASQSANLSVRGESRMGQSPLSLGGMGRMQTFVSLDRGSMQMGLDRSNLPPLTERMGMTSPPNDIMRMSLQGNGGGKSYLTGTPRLFWQPGTLQKCQLCVVWPGWDPWEIYLTRQCVFKQYYQLIFSYVFKLFKHFCH